MNASITSRYIADRNRRADEARRAEYAKHADWLAALDQRVEDAGALYAHTVARVHALFETLNRHEAPDDPELWRRVSHADGALSELRQAIAARDAGRQAAANAADLAYWRVIGGPLY